MAHPRSSGAPASWLILILMAGPACSDPPTEVIPPDDTEPVFEGRWTSTGHLPAALHSFGAAMFEDRLYVVGGDTGIFATVKDVYRYDPQTDLWETLGDLPVNRAHHALVVVGDTMYAAGGFFGNGGGTVTPATTVWAYRPDTDTWEPRADLPEPRLEAAAAAVGGELYLIGGLSDLFERNTGDSMTIYNPATDRWRNAAGPINPRSRAQAVVFQERIYLVSGNTAEVTFVDVAPVEMYDPATDTWSVVSQLPERRIAAAAVRLGTRLHVVGGTGINLSPTSAHEALDLITGEWTQLRPLPQGSARQELRLVVMDGALHSLGGRAQSVVFDVIQRYHPE